MKLYSWNVNGIRAAIKNGYAEWFDKVSPDVLCLQETKANKEQVDPKYAEPENYYAFWNSAQKKGYSGVATFTKKNPDHTIYKFGIDKFDTEGRLIFNDFGEFVLYNIYFPNGQRDHNRVPFKLEFYDTFLAHAEQNRKSGKHIVVCGDFNTAHKEIDLTHPKANKNTTGFLPIERAWLDKFVEYGYVDTFRHFNREPEQYTWWTYRMNARQRNIGWRLDYFFVNREFLSRVKNAFILQEVMGSDHCPVGIEIDF